MQESAKTPRDTDALLEEALVAAAQEVVSVRADAEARVSVLNAELDSLKTALAEAQQDEKARAQEIAALRGALDARPLQRPLEALIGELRPQLAAHEQAAQDDAHRRALELELLVAEAQRALMDLRETHADLTENHETLLAQVERLEERFAETAAELRAERDRADALESSNVALSEAVDDVQAAAETELRAQQMLLVAAKAEQAALAQSNSAALVDAQAALQAAGLHKAELEQGQAELRQAHAQALAEKDRLHMARIADAEDIAEQAQVELRDALARAEQAESALAQAGQKIEAELTQKLQATSERAAVAEQALDQFKATAARELQVTLENGQTREQELRKDLEASLEAIASLETAHAQTERRAAELEAKVVRAEKSTAELQTLWESSAAELDRAAEEGESLSALVERLQLELAQAEEGRTAERNALQAELDTLIATHDTVENAGTDERRKLTQQVEALEAQLDSLATQQDGPLRQLQAAYDALLDERLAEQASHEAEVAALLEARGSGPSDRGSHARLSETPDPGAIAELRKELAWLREDRGARLQSHADSELLLQRERDRMREMSRELHELRADNIELRGRAKTAPHSKQGQGPLGLGPSGTAFGLGVDLPASEVVPLPRADSRPAPEAPDSRTERRERKERRLNTGTSYAVNDIQEEVIFRPPSRRPGGKHG